jgi:hypothetical protein
VARLASKIGALAGPQKTISITVKNISSLSEVETTGIRQGLEADLAKRGLRVAGESSAETQANVTLSEGEQGYVWVAEVRRGSTERTEMVSAPKIEAASGHEASGALLLEKRLTWEQAGKFLDFTVLTNPMGFYSTLVILEPSRLAFYRSADATNWQSWHTVDIPRPNPWNRDLSGSIDEEAGNAYLAGGTGFLRRPNVRCTGGFERPEGVQCSRWSDDRIIETVGPKSLGHEQSEGVLLWTRCGQESVVLSTGTGDWTQPDSIQGYLLSSLTGDAVPSGVAIEMEGPVVALQRVGRQSAVRAVVHNLRTGNYEGYIVTATCGN